MSGVHERIDMSRWVSEFSLAKARAEARAFVEANERRRPGTYTTPVAMEAHARMMSPDGDIVVGPRELAWNEQLRAELGGDGEAGQRTPVDVMVWARGEPANPAATKIGGVPWRPRSAAWPRGQDGGPAQFLGQICFADSRDVVRDGRGRELELPGDVLLLYNTAPDGVFNSDDEDPESLGYEWWSLDIGDRVGPSDLPAMGARYEQFGHTHAHLHRTADFAGLPEHHPWRGIVEWPRVAVVEGGKIGGSPLYVQHDDPRPGTFIAALGSINPVGPRFPLLNVPVNPDGEFNMSSGRFYMFGDCGSLYLFWDAGAKGGARLRWTVQGY